MASIPTAAPPGDRLRRQLGRLDATMITTIIGASIFSVPASIALLFTASFPTVLVWIAGGLVSLCAAVCVAKLGAAMPARTGRGAIR